MYKFLTGAEPATLEVKAEEQPSIGGLVTGFAGGAATNLPEAGVRLRIYELDAATGERKGAPALELTTAADGRWGPLRVTPARHFEFELEKDGQFVRYFRSPFARSSDVVNLRWRPVTKSTTLAARPQGYFSRDRDPLKFNGEPVAGVPAGVPSADVVPLAIGAGGALELRGERIPIRPANGAGRELHIADFNWD